MSSPSPCTELGIPERLHRHERPILNEFPADAGVYRRFGTETPSPDVFSVKRMSVAVSTLCGSPTDVLFNSRSPEHYFSWGIAELAVAQIEARQYRLDLPNQPTRIFTLKLVHVPEDCMYPHCEVHIFENGALLEDVKPNSIRTKIREDMANMCRLIKASETQAQPPA